MEPSFTIPAKFRLWNASIFRPRIVKRGAIRQVGLSGFIRGGCVHRVGNFRRRVALTLSPREFIRNFVAAAAAATGRRFYEAVNLLGTKGVVETGTGMMEDTGGPRVLSRRRTLVLTG